MRIAAPEGVAGTGGDGREKMAGGAGGGYNAGMTTARMFFDKLHGFLVAMEKVLGFRQVIQIRLPRSARAVAKANKRRIEAMSLQWEGDFQPALDLWVRTETEKALKNTDRVVGEACIILGHTVLEGFVFDLLNVVKDADPALWHKIKNQKSGKLVSNVALLVQVCNSEAVFQNADPATYDPKKIEPIDRLRHKLIHEHLSAPDLGDVDDHLEHIRKLGVLLGFSIQSKYKFRAIRNITSVRSSSAKTAPPKG